MDSLNVVLHPLLKVLYYAIDIYIWLLIAMAITVAFAASLASSLGWFDLEFWWELAALITIMLLGHWQEMKAIGQARGALDALAELLPDDAERVGPDGEVRSVPASELEVGDVGLPAVGLVAQVMHRCPAGQ